MPRPEPEESDAAERLVPEPSAPVRRTLGFLLHDTARLMRRRFVQLAREAELPLNRSEAAVLLHVAHQQGISQASLAAALDIEPISLVRLLDRLQEADLIERRPHSRDRRRRTIWLTEAAHPMLERISSITQAVREEAFAGFRLERREALIEELVQIRANLCRAPDWRELY